MRRKSWCNSLINMPDSDKEVAGREAQEGGYILGERVSGDHDDDLGKYGPAGELGNLAQEVGVALVNLK